MYCTLSTTQKIHGKIGLWDICCTLWMEHISQKPGACDQIGFGEYMRDACCWCYPCAVALLLKNLCVISCLHTPVTVNHVTRQYRLVKVERWWCSVAGKVSIGLASHWTCITYISGLSTRGFHGQVRELSTPPMLCLGLGHFTLPTNEETLSHVTL